MHLIDDWRNVLNKAWSVRLAVIAGALGGAEMAIPAFMDSLPHGPFLILSMLVSVGSALARVVDQPRMRDGQQ